VFLTKQIDLDKLRINLLLRAEEKIQDNNENLNK
jgi:hypothetical protein